MKFLFIFLLIIVLVFMFLNIIRRGIQKFFSGFTTGTMNQNGTFTKKQSANQTDEVIYRKDDVVVLKGEAKESDKKQNK